MKTEVIKALQERGLQPKQRFDKLFGLFLKHKEANQTLARHFNATGFSPEALKNLEYEITKLYGISAVELRSKPKKEVLKVVTDELTAPTFSKGIVGNAERKAWLKEKGIEHDLKKNDELDALIKATLEKAAASADTTGETLTKTFAEAPDDVKAGFKLREAFPFLSAPDCPDVFKIAVADMFTAHEQFLTAREEVVAAREKGLSNEELFEIGKKAVAEFTVNRALWAELEHYKATGEILGEAPLFFEEALKQKVANYSVAEADKRLKNLRKYITRDERALAAMEPGEEKDKFQEKMNAWELEFDLIEKREVKA